MNIGYHNEHHDFTKVPWSKLPKVKSIAPEFYNSLTAHYSWTKVMYDFIFDKTIGPQSRVARSYDDHKRARGLPSKTIEKNDSGTELQNTFDIKWRLE